MDKLAYRLAVFATMLAFIVVVLGAYTRLTDAGLGCPDWPGCYGQLIPPSTALDLDSKKAWTEMLHRYLAGLLGLLILAIGILAIRNRQVADQPFALPLLLVALVIFQAALGRWTVTLRLYPLVVVAHLMGGFTTLSLLGWLSLKLRPMSILPIGIPSTQLQSLQVGAWLGLAVLIIQLFLGGWTSANYAALVCLDFPFCQAREFFPGSSAKPSNFFSAFNLIAAGIPNSFGNSLDINARIVIHMLHRLGAAITAIILSGLAIRILRSLSSSRFFRGLSVSIIILLITQLLLGVSNVLAVLPLSVAVSHTAVAALLLLAMVTLNHALLLAHQAK